MSSNRCCNPRFPQAPILPNNCECVAMYTAKAGDTLYSISQYYGVPVAKLMQVNRIMNPYCLKIGQQICIPGAVHEEPPCNGTLYTLVEGDTLYAIARRFQVTLDALMESNPTLDPYNLWVGTKICIPGTKAMKPPCMDERPYMETASGTLRAVPNSFVAQNPAAPTTQQPSSCKGQMYSLREGDNFYVLAKRYNINLADLLDANPNLDPYHLQVGTSICIPMPEEIIQPQVPTPAPQQMMPQVTMPAPQQMMPQVTMPMPQQMMPQVTMPNLQQMMPQITIPTPQQVTPKANVPTVGRMTAPHTTPSCDGLLHTVCEGDTLYMISKEYHISLDDLIRANPDLDPYNLQVGMKLCVPVPRHLPGAPMEQQGMQEEMHEHMQNRMPESMSDMNMKMPESMSDMNMKMPESGMEMMPGYYFVHIGDTLDHLCRQFQVMPNNMMKANPALTVKDFSVPGTKVCIPR